MSGNNFLLLFSSLNFWKIFKFDFFCNFWPQFAKKKVFMKTAYILNLFLFLTLDNLPNETVFQKLLLP